MINRVSLVVGLLEIVVEGGSDHRPHLWEKFENRARTLHFNNNFVVVCSILLSIHLSDVQPFDVVKLYLSDVWHIDDGRPLLLRLLKLLSILSKSLSLPLELLVSSFLVVMKNIIHKAKFNLDLIELDVVILNHSVLPFQIQDILTEELEEDLLAQDIVVLPDGELLLQQVREHGQKEWLTPILLFLERI